MWQKMIQDLRRAGYTFQEIADPMGIGRSSVHDLFTGRSHEPKGKAAIELNKLHDKLLKSKKRATPKK